MTTTWSASTLSRASSLGSPIDVGDDPADIAIGKDDVWTANFGDATVSRITP